MSESRIHSALVAGYIESGVMPSDRTAFEGREFTPLNGQSWARLTLLPTGRAPAGLGSSAPQEWTGIFQVDLFHPNNTGHADILAGVDTLQKVFRSGGRISYNGQSVLIRRTERSKIRQEEVWQSVGVSIYCASTDTGYVGEGLILELGGGADASKAISADSDNRLSIGSDQKLYVPNDLTPDPLAYYILARN